MKKMIRIAIVMAIQAVAVLCATSTKAATLIYTVDDIMQQKAEVKAKEVIDEIIKPEMSEIDEIFVVHDWICKNTEYQKGHPTDYVCAGPLLTGKGCCAGYSDTFNLFMDLLGIDCIQVDGKMVGTEFYHRWNEVNIRGNRYQIDCTFDDNDDPEKPYDRQYCLLTPDQMVRTGKMHRTVLQYDAKDGTKEPFCPTVKSVWY